MDPCYDTLFTRKSTYSYKDFHWVCSPATWDGLSLEGPLPKPRSLATVTLATFVPPELVTNPDRVAVDTASCMAVNSIAKQSQDLRILVERAKSIGRSKGDLVRCVFGGPTCG
jgi:hypothetical protein